MTIIYGILILYVAILALGFLTNGFGGKGLVPFAVGVGKAIAGVAAAVGAFHKRMLLGPAPVVAKIAPFEK